MMKNIFYSALLFSTSVLLFSCNENGDKDSSGKDTTASIQLTPIPDEASSKSSMALTKIEFLESSFDFGKIDEGKKVEHQFKFKNTGENPLVIQEARASCGCTVPEYTKDTIAPGAEGQIKVIYDSSNKEGQINKTVTVTANTEPSTTDIKISAFVLKKVAGPYTKQ